MINVFVIDDSAIVRQTVLHLLSGSSELALMGSAPNPLIAESAIRRARPDVLLLDIEMPGMDGLTYLRKVMASASPIPTVICSTLTEEGSRTALEALAAGAVSVISKPRLGLKDFLENSRRELLSALKNAAQARPRSHPSATRPSVPRADHRTIERSPNHSRALAVNKPIVIGGSTGGTQAVEQVLQELPEDCPGIAVVLHMPEKFTAMYARRLNGSCAMQVREAQDGDRLQRGLALIAPGGHHMQLRQAGGQYFVAIQDGPPVNRHKPSVDVLFRSTAESAGHGAMALLLTGMGDDGARGLLQLRGVGATTIAQDEASCVVYGMPKEAVALEAADKVLSLDDMSGAILGFDARA